MNDKPESTAAVVPPRLESLQKLIFELPLYVSYDVGHSDKLIASLFWNREKLRIDGWCLTCSQERTHQIEGSTAQANSVNFLRKLSQRHWLQASCTKCGDIIWLTYNIAQGLVTKIGQNPSLAEIANSEVKQFRKLLPDDWGSEFHKAIVLAAHGYGVASFVYLRRIFEKLILKKFNEH